ncbi:DUF6659 family protein [Nitrosopumilus sp.]|uniref:DUF6659 family protein n=1 Tax=Nitrosopumilus sp. TaxID=2024843 RepID=UPI003B5B8A40
MSVLTASEIAELEKECSLILENDDVKFVGGINNLGNLIAGGFSKKMKSVGSEQTWKMMYMQLKLDIEMRKDYDELFGPVRYVISKRRDVEKISIPVGSHMILVITKLNFEIAKIEEIIATFKSILDNSS